MISIYWVPAILVKDPLIENDQSATETSLKKKKERKTV